MNLAKNLIAAAISLVGLSAQSYATTTLYANDLQSTTDLSTFSRTRNAVIGTAQDGTKALTFTQKEPGTNIFTTNQFSSTTGYITVSFDYFSSCGFDGQASSNCGGVVYADPQFIATDTPFGTVPVIQDAAAWQNASFTLQRSDTYVTFQVWSDALYATAGDGNGTGASFYMKNLLITDSSVGYGEGLVVKNISAVPEPETYAMLMAGLGMLGAAVKRRQAKQA